MKKRVAFWLKSRASTIRNRLNCFSKLPILPEKTSSGLDWQISLRKDPGCGSRATSQQHFSTGLQTGLMVGWVRILFILKTMLLWGSGMIVLIKFLMQFFLLCVKKHCKIICICYKNKLWGVLLRLLFLKKQAWLVASWNYNCLNTRSQSSNANHKILAVA